MALAILAFWTDVDPAQEDDFNDWYNREHLHERLGVPGFRTGTRYQSLGDGPRYFTFYETDSLDVLSSPGYLARLNDPTPWTRRVMPALRNVTRTAMTIRDRVGAGSGGVAATVRLSPERDKADGFEAWLADRLLPELAATGAVTAQFWQGDDNASQHDTAERAIRKGGDGIADWVILAEATDTENLTEICRAHLAPAELKARGAAPDIEIDMYRLLYRLSAVEGAH